MSGPDEAHEEQVGNVGEEAAKLLGALADWASDSAKELNAHVATGDAECLYCPICRTVHAVRQASPEVRAHLAVAASSFLQAAAGLLATVSTGDQPASSVQRIDLDSDDSADPDDDETDDTGDDTGEPLPDGVGDHP